MSRKLPRNVRAPRHGIHEEKSRISYRSPIWPYIAYIAYISYIVLYRPQIRLYNLHTLNNLHKLDYTKEKSRHGQPKSVILQSALNPWTDGISKNRNAQLELLYTEFKRSHMIVTIFSRLLVTRLLRTLFSTIGSRHGHSTERSFTKSIESSNPIDELHTEALRTLRG